MSTKYAWKWEDDPDTGGQWHPTLLRALRAWQLPTHGRSLVRRKTTKRGWTIEAIGYGQYARAFDNFIKCQIGALAVDMGLPTHAMVKRMERALSITIDQACYEARQQSSVRVARVLILAASVGSLTSVRGALTALRLRSPKVGETKPTKLMEAFIQAEFPR